MTQIIVTTGSAGGIDVAVSQATIGLPVLSIAAGDNINIAEANGTRVISGTLNLASATPSNLGVSAAGTGTAAARADHVHAMPSLGDLADVTLSSPAAGEVLTWNGTAWAAAADSTNLTGYATETFVDAAVASLIDSSPAALDTLNELAAALGDDANFAANVTASLAGKASLNHTHEIGNITGLQAALDAKAVTASLATVATSGNYTDLAGLPTLGTAAATNSTDYATAAQGLLADSAVQPAELATVATSGNYSDLSGIPTEFTPAAHTHTPGDITDFASAAAANAPIQGVNSLTGDIVIANGTGLTLAANGTTLTLEAALPPSNLADLADVSGSPTTGQALVYNGTEWQPGDVAAGTTLNGLSGALTLAAGDNVTITTSGSTLAFSAAGGGGITWASEPAASNSSGTAGQIAYGSGFFYLHDGTEWRRAALSTFGTVAPTITITQQPQNLTLADGGSGNLTVAATVSDSSTPTYQWQSYNGSAYSDIANATAATYTLANVSAAANGTQYRAIVSATGASDVTSDVATLTVSETFDLLAENGDRLMTEGGDSLDHDGDGATLTITSQPQNTTAVGGEASFAVAATVSDGSALTYQWEEETLVNAGATWTQRALPAFSTWFSVAYGNGTFVAVSQNTAATSTDGITWTQRTLPPAADWNGIAYGNGTFVVVAKGNIAATSTDGITWTQRTLPANRVWQSVTYGDGLFVAVAQYSNIAATSADGITWTQRTLPALADWYGVAYGNGTFVAVPFNSNIAATSPDGITWAQETLPVSSSWYGITYGNGTFVAVAPNTVSATSPDGITWTQRALPAFSTWFSVAYGNGTFVAVASGNVAATSTDGITWTQRTLPANRVWQSVTYGDGLFVAVAQYSNIAATSDSTLQFLPISGETASTLSLTGLTSADDGERYRVVVDSPSVEPVTSTPATLTVT